MGLRGSEEEVWYVWENMGWCVCVCVVVVVVVFFFNDTATTEIYTLSLHDALPILFTGYWGG